MTQIHDFELDVRRHSDGSIDFDHYRSRAAALRCAALRDASICSATTCCSRSGGCCMGKSFAVVIESYLPGS